MNITPDTVICVCEREENQEQLKAALDGLREAHETINYLKAIMREDRAVYEGRGKQYGEEMARYYNKMQEQADKLAELTTEVEKLAKHKKYHMDLLNSNVALINMWREQAKATGDDRLLDLATQLENYTTEE